MIAAPQGTGLGGDRKWVCAPYSGSPRSLREHSGGVNVRMRSAFRILAVACAAVVSGCGGSSKTVTVAGTSTVADSANATPSIVRLNPGSPAVHIGDVAVVGEVQCRAWTQSRSHPIKMAHLRCSIGSRSRSPYYVDIDGGQINVYKKGRSAPVYSTPFYHH